MIANRSVGFSAVSLLPPPRIAQRISCFVVSEMVYPFYWTFSPTSVPKHEFLLVEACQ
jgi:hypothetical protein